MQRSSGPRRRKPHCKECNECADECRNGNAHIVVESLAKQPAAQIHTNGSCQRCIEESNPVATELNTESTAGKSGSDSHLKRSVVARALAYILQFLGILLNGVVFGDGLPCELRNKRDGGHVDTVLGAALEFGERVFAVAEVHHEHVELHIHMEVLLGQSEKSGHTVHVADDTVGVSSAFDKHLTGLQKQVELAT